MHRGKMGNLLYPFSLREIEEVLKLESKTWVYGQNQCIEVLKFYIPCPVLVLA
jgi:hypothetical protein